MSAMSTVHDICKEMHDATALLASRQAVCRDDARGATLQKRLISSIAAKIGHMLVLIPSDAKLLLDATAACGFDEGGCAVVVASIDSKLQGQLETTPVTAVSNKNQMFTRPCNWATDEFVQSMKGRANIDVKLVVAAEYLANTCGCTHPHEQTYRHWLTLVLLCHYDVWPLYKTVYGHLQYMKDCVATCRKQWSLPRLATYPQMPHELPPHIYQHIFQHGDPIVLKLDRFDVMANHHVPLRKNSLLIRNEEKGHARGSKTEIEQPLANQQSMQSTSVKAEEMPAWARAVLAASGGVKLEPKAEPARDPDQPAHTRVKTESPPTPSADASPRESAAASPVASPPMALKPRLAVSELEFRDSHNDKV
jgi:hypothetical protein